MSQAAHITDLPKLKPNHTTTFLATAAGVAFGMILSVGVMGSLGDSTASPVKTVSAKPASFTPSGDGIYYNGQYYSSLSDVCAAPTSSMGTGGGGAGVVLGASTVAKPAFTPSTPVPGGRGGGGGQPGGSGGKTVFITKLIGGATNKTTASNSYTGPGSTNVIKSTNVTKTTVNNNNDVTITNNNTQKATSGDATAKYNTTTGTTSSGTASNQSDTNFTVNISN